MVQLCEGLGDDQSEAEALGAGGTVKLFEGGEELGEDVGGDADTGVGDAEGEVVGAVEAEVDADGAVFGGEFHRVGEEVGEDLPDAEGIGDGEMREGGERGGDVEAFCGELVAEAVEGGGDELGEVYGFGVEGDFVAGDAVVVEEVVDEGDFGAEVSADELEVFADVVREVGVVVEEVEGGGDGGEGGAEFVGEGGEEAVFGGVGGFGDDAGGEGLVAGGAEGGFGFDAFHGEGDGVCDGAEEVDLGGGEAVAGAYPEAEGSDDAGADEEREAGVGLDSQQGDVLKELGRAVWNGMVPDALFAGLSDDAADRETEVVPLHGLLDVGWYSQCTVEAEAGSGGGGDEEEVEEEFAADDFAGTGGDGGDDGGGVLGTEELAGDFEKELEAGLGEGGLGDGGHG